MSILITYLTSVTTFFSRIDRKLARTAYLLHLERVKESWLERERLIEKGTSLIEVTSKTYRVFDSKHSDEILKIARKLWKGHHQDRLMEDHISITQEIEGKLGRPLTISIPVFSKIID